MLTHVSLAALMDDVVSWESRWTVKKEMTWTLWRVLAVDMAGEGAEEGVQQLSGLTLFPVFPAAPLPYAPLLFVHALFVPRGSFVLLAPSAPSWTSRVV